MDTLGLISKQIYSFRTNLEKKLDFSPNVSNYTSSEELENSLELDLELELELNCPSSVIIYGSGG